MREKKRVFKQNQGTKNIRIKKTKLRSLERKGSAFKKKKIEPTEIRKFYPVLL